ncbi:MAG TPA: MarR family transcriptional regulator [Rubrobacter sp.]|nr:MarR family transcriptional regulator [Rubrobacter sp.]
MDREKLVDETLMLLPTLMRLVERPSPVEFGEMAHRGLPDVQVSPGHIQVLIALTRGPRSVGKLAEELGVSPPAATQLVDKLTAHGMVRRHNDPADRRVVLVDYVEGMHEVARTIVEKRRRPLQAALSKMTDDEASAFVKGLKLVADSFGTAGEES